MFLGIDQGTTSSRAVIVDVNGKLRGSGRATLRQFFPKPGWVEHSADDIWKGVGQSVKEALRQAGISGHKIRAIGISNQRETVSLFDQNQALHRFIVWQDRRTADFCNKLKRHERFVAKRSGLPIDPYFSASKIRWLLDELKIKRGRNPSSLRFRTIDSFLLHRLTGEDLIETTNASRTSLLNLQSRQWDDELFELFGIPKNLAPKLAPSEGLGLKTKDVGFLPAGIPVEAVLGDQQAALFGQNGWKKGSGKITFGTGSFILLNTGEKRIFSKNSMISTVAIEWSKGACDYALEGSAFISGAWIQWLRDGLHMLKTSGDSKKLASSVLSSDGVLIIPALTGMGAPFWKPEIRGAILGLTRGTTRKEIARASLEALCFQNKALIDAMKKDTQQIDLKMNWRVDGGAVANDLLLQIQADVLRSKMIRPENLESTVFGVSNLAAYSKGELSLNDIEQLWKKNKEFKPDLKTSHYYAELYERWLNAIQRLS